MEKQEDCKHENYKPVSTGIDSEGPFTTVQCQDCYYCWDVRP